jgi:hypothetical protein
MSECPFSNLPRSNGSRGILRSGLPSEVYLYHWFITGTIIVPVWEVEVKIRLP